MRLATITRLADPTIAGSVEASNWNQWTLSAAGLAATCHKPGKLKRVIKSNGVKQVKTLSKFRANKIRLHLRVVLYRRKMTIKLSRTQCIMWGNLPKQLILDRYSNILTLSNTKARKVWPQCLTSKVVVQAINRTLMIWLAQEVAGDNTHIKLPALKAKLTSIISRRLYLGRTVRRTTTLLKNQSNLLVSKRRKSVLSQHSILHTIACRLIISQALFSMSSLRVQVHALINNS